LTQDRKRRTQVSLSERVIRQIDRAVSRSKRSRFLEQAALAQLRRDALRMRSWVGLAEKFKGLTLEDTYYPARAELEARGG